MPADTLIPPVQAAADLARTLRRRGLVAAADTITCALTAQTETAAASAGEPARGEVP